MYQPITIDIATQKRQWEEILIVIQFLSGLTLSLSGIHNQLLDDAFVPTLATILSHLSHVSQAINSLSTPASSAFASTRSSGQGHGRDCDQGKDIFLANIAIVGILIIYQRNIGINLVTWVGKSS